MISNTEKNIIIDTLKPYNPVFIGLFGSYARNEEAENSDIDILYDFKSDYTLFDLMDIKELLKNKLNKNVDLVSRQFLNRHFVQSINNDLKILFNA
ncbi:MAG: nucleotidyltransferase domain-containing protein [Bacteroidetes bacterium]|jgi:predicted nucleotidyltransferase|nr:nucleotidyltransferase domain-containing protein [Bacteroidota bacterium]